MDTASGWARAALVPAVKLNARINTPHRQPLTMTRQPTQFASTADYITASETEDPL